MGRLQLGLHQVISFYFLAKERSFSRAAEQLAITQPAVTQHVRSLEVQFGVTLVNVKKKRVHLTKAGERLFAYAEELYNQAMVTEQFLKGYRFNNISIGMSGPLMLSFTALIDSYKELYPSIRISIREGSSQTLLEELLDFKHDICFIGMQSSYTDKIHYLRIPYEEPLVFVTSPEYEIPFDTPLSWTELQSYPLIIQSEGSSSREILLHQFRERGLKPNIGAEVDNTAFAKELARQKKGLALMFEPNVLQEIASNELKTVHLEDGPIRVGAVDIIWRRKENPSPTVDSLLILIKKHFKERIEHKASPP
jgi:DNA-binding transcriptional LysR family regulator